MINIEYLRFNVLIIRLVLLIEVGELHSNYYRDDVEDNRPE